MIKRTLIIGMCLLNLSSFAQKVGVVLSGGGASGISHIGFLKALEENNIPIDYITGNSMGALVGGLYAAGYSPAEIEIIFTSEDFQNMAKGQLEDRYRYFFKEEEPDASWVSIKFSKDTILQTTLPTNVISPVALDFAMMEMFSSQASKAGYNFDSLYIPFRCVASDIEAKEVVVFRKGHLSQAIRASMSYPFYLKPITVDGKLLFDGGLYNNFPSDIMEEDFSPDIILGCNVSGNFAPPDEDDLISQIKTMLVSKTDYTIDSTKGVCIEPKFEIGLFEFNRSEFIIKKGYDATVEQMAQIKKLISRNSTEQEVTDKRSKYQAGLPPINFSKIEINGLTKGQEQYVRGILIKRKDSISNIQKMKPRYFKVFGDDKIRSIYPTAIQENGSFTLDLKVKKEKDILLDFGGNFSNRPINQAYLGVQYNYLGNIGASVRGNFYFGKLYGSAQGKIRFDFPISLPFYLEGHFTLNRWDYFKSKAEFFEPATTSFLIQNENFYGGKAAFPVKNKGKMLVGINAGEQRFSYYQTDLFLPTDTPDFSSFNFTSAFARYERSTLNHKQYANSGTYLSFSAMAVEGEEFNRPGSTSEQDRTFSKLHEFLQFKFSYQNYYKKKGGLRLGVLLEGVYSTQENFNNYTASVLRAPSFQPTPESKTLFLESFRAYQYLAAGHQFIFNVKNSFDLRLAGYIFQPYQELLRDTEGFATNLGEPFEKRYTIASASLIYHSPLGPASIGLNYYHNVPGIAPTERTPLTFLFHFGYVIFNNKALD